MKPNNMIALIIAVGLIVAGFMLGFINRQSDSAQHKETLAHIALIHDDIGTSSGATQSQSELVKIRDSIDWSDAPSPAPEKISTDDYDVFINVTKEYLLYVYDKLGYTGAKIDSGETTAIPPLLMVSIAKGWADGETVQFKKSIFYRVVLSLVLFENEAVLRERAQLLTILDARDSSGTLTASQSKELNHLAFSYRVLNEESEEPINDEQINELLTRVDMVAPSLALAQAAHESGYATSRFAHTGNALFGQWDWSADAIKPQQQRKGMGNYGVKSFNQPIDSVRAYIWNLNTHRAYAGFREARALQRGEQLGRVVLDGIKLAGTLTSYSERREEYTKELQSTMNHNKLNIADDLRLIEGEPIYFD